MSTKNEEHATTQTARKPPKMIGKVAIARLIGVTSFNARKRIKEGVLPPPSPFSVLAGREVWAVQDLRDFYRQRNSPIADLLTDEALIEVTTPPRLG